MNISKSDWRRILIICNLCQSISLIRCRLRSLKCCRYKVRSLVMTSVRALKIILNRWFRLVIESIRGTVLRSLIAAWLIWKHVPCKHRDETSSLIIRFRSPQHVKRQSKQRVHLRITKTEIRRRQTSGKTGKTLFMVMERMGDAAEDGRRRICVLIKPFKAN